jgi:hypothetical protein
VACTGVGQVCGFSGTALLNIFFGFALAGFSWWLWVVWKKLLGRDKPQIWKQALITMYAYLLFQATFLLFLDSLSFLFQVVALRREKRSKLV